MQTPARDLPVYLALTGNDEDPAVEGIDPDVSAELYTTNGEFTDWAHHERGRARLDLGARARAATAAASSSPTTRRWSSTSSRSTCRSRSTWRARRPTRRGRSRTSATRPSRSTSTLSERRPDLRQQPARGLPLRASPTATRSRSRCSPATRCASVTLKYRINGGAHAAAPAPSAGRAARPSARATTPTTRSGAAVVRGTEPGDSVEVWFTGKRPRQGEERQGQAAAAAGHGGRSQRLVHLRGRVSESGADTLVVAAEDYTGISPAQARRPELPRLLHRGARPPTGSPHDVYDVDAQGRDAPDALGVLGHYDAVVWYTGDDVITREPGMVAGHRLAPRQRRDARDALLHERGRQRPLHGQERRRPVPGRVRLRPGRQRALRRRPGGHRALPAALERLPPVLPGRLPVQRRRRPRRRAPASRSPSTG